MAQAPTTLYAVNGPPLANMNVQFQPAPPTLPQAAADRANNLLQLYIIDYCEKHNFRDSAEALRREAQVQQSHKAPVDSKEGLLYEWWTCFWEVYTARVHPDRAHSKVAKEYSDNLHQGKINPNRDPGVASNQRLAGPSRPYVNGASGHPPPPSVNGHGAPVQYTNTPPGAQNGPGPLSGNSGATPTQVSNNPMLQHLQPQQQQQQPPRPVNGRSFAGQGMPVGSQPGAPHPIPPGSQMQPRGVPNGNPAQTNPNLRQVTTQHSNSPQNQDPNSSPRNPNVSDNANPRPESSDTPRGGRSRKRGNEDDSTTEKEGATPERKKFKKSPPENGAPLPSPSLASAQPVGPGRPPPPTGFSTPFPAGRLGPPGGMQSMPPQPGPAGVMNPGPPAALTRAGSGIVTQLRELEAVRASQTDQHQQHFQHMQEATITAYKPNGPLGPGFDPSAQPRPTTVGPPNVVGRGAMGPPPPPNAGQPPQMPGVLTPGGKPPVNGLLPPAQPGTKDGSPKIDGVSPENTRPASRAAPSTPQQVPSAPTPTGMISTPGGHTAPSPAQLATPQQISRPPTQSPGAPPSTVGLGPTASAATTPAALLARGPSAGPPMGGTMPGGFTAMPPANILNGSMIPPSSSSLGGAGGGPTGATMGIDSSSDSLFGSLDDFGLQMMNFQEPFSGMAFDFPMEDFFQDSSLDSMGTGTGA